MFCIDYILTQVYNSTDVRVWLSTKLSCERSFYMMGKTHKTGGVLVGVVASDMFLQRNMIITGICVVLLINGAVLGSLLPDIDKKESTIGRKLWFISWPIYFMRLIIKLLSWLSPRAFRSFYNKVHKAIGHRYLAHSLITWSVISFYIILGCFNLANYICSLVDINILMNTTDIQEVIKKGMFAFSLGISLGMLSHIILDLLTKEGVAIFAPIIDKRLRFPLQIRTNGFGEHIICMIMNILIPVASFIILFPYIMGFF
jgi:inner membrane protein